MTLTVEHALHHGLPNTEGKGGCFLYGFPQRERKKRWRNILVPICAKPSASAIQVYGRTKKKTSITVSCRTAKAPGDWILFSNTESSEGFSKILAGDAEVGISNVIEVKYPKNGDLEKGCAEALAQIEGLGYETRLRDNGIEQILKLEIACYKKEARGKGWE